MTAFITLAEVERSLLHDKPRRRFVIPDVLPAGPVLLYGASGSGKTGIAIRTAVAVADGLQWADREVTPGSVLYVVGEDIDGAKERMVAAARALGREPAELPIAIMEAPQAGLVTSEARLAIMAAAKQLAKQTALPTALVVVDTLAASFGPKSQDDATAASEYMNHADRTARELGCAFLSIHHTGKSEEAGMRGSRVFFDRADAVLKVKRGQGATSFMQVDKMRNGPGGARFCFDIAGIDVATAAGPISVQVIRDLRAMAEDSGSPADATEKRKQTIADQMLAALVRVGGVTGAPVVAWQSTCYDLWPDKKPETKRKLFSNTKKRMQDEGTISVAGETVTVTVTSDAMVTPLVTPEPETVTVTVTNPVSIDTGDSDRRTGRKENPVLQEQDGESLTGKAGEDEERIRKANAFRRGIGGETPEETTSRAGDDDGDGRQSDAA